MKSALSFALIALAFSSPAAFAESKSSGASSAGSGFTSMLGKGGNRFGITYQQGKMSNVESKRIEPLEKVPGVLIDASVGHPLSVVMGLEYLESKDAKVTWKSAVDTPVQFYDLMIKLGFRGTLPIPLIQPWIGGGVNVGTMTFTNPSDRPFNNVTIGFLTRGTVGAWGTYAEGGIDLKIGTSGIRGSYTLARRITDPSDPLTGDKYTMTMQIVSIGFFAEL